MTAASMARSMPQMSWVWALATVSKGQLDNTIVPSARCGAYPHSVSASQVQARAVPGLPGASDCSGLVSDDVSCFPSTLPIVGNVSSP